MATVTERLLAELNAIRGVKYPQIGYSYFADIRGNGDNRRRVYVITNENGGVSYSELNGATSRQRCDKIRDAIEAENRKRYGVTLDLDPARPWFPAEMKLSKGNDNANS